MRKGRDTLIFETKKSSKMIEAARWQIYYYLWYVKKRYGQNLKGVLVIPLEKKREVLELTDDIEREIERMRNDIERIVNLEKPPPPIRKRFCRKCSYYSLCYG
mgnify:CR=1 FL=1